MKYIALLRGVNVGGKNKVSMKQLKDCFLEAGFTSVQTYINSGNILFDSNRMDEEENLQEYCQQKLETAFGFPIVVAIITANELSYALGNAPKWWGEDTDARHNALFTIHSITAEEVLNSMGEIKEEYEKVFAFGKVIFWTASIQHYSRTRYSKIVGTEAYKKVTVRNANTTRKLVLMSKANEEEK